ncbi:hypothetical protein [Pseudomonas sp.]|uniref:MrpH family fimbial adhesin n=1 Tax=Pseudomonas sp. TaxID=306 RepID=UPI002631B543|nr:hypothetical protein [Pseudomonas sp.]
MTLSHSFCRPLLALALWIVMPAANAYLLSTHANNDPRPSPIPSGSDTMVVSGTATATDNGVPNQYPGKVLCPGATTPCKFGPVASPILNTWYRFVTAMNCTNFYDGLHCANNNDTSVTVTTNMTWDQAISAWRARFGNSVSRYNAYYYPSNMIYRMCTSWATFASNGASSSYLLPGADSCGPPPIPPNQCNVSGGTVMLDHGTLKVGEITGKKVEVTRQVKCTREASVTYTVASGNPVNLGNGIRSTLSVNGVNAGQTIKLPGGTSNLKIASTLTDQGAVAGPFSKTVVLIQNIL